MSQFTPALARQLNDSFAYEVETQEGKVKVAEYTGNMIRDRLREFSFAHKVLTPRKVEKSELRPAMRSDTVYKVLELEPQSRAMVMSFRGQPKARVIRGPRVEVGFFTISSELMQKTEQELLAYEMPITKIVEDNIAKDMEEIIDREFLRHVESCVQAMQYEKNNNATVSLTSVTVQNGSVVEYSVKKGELARAASGTPDARIYPAQKQDFVTLREMIDDRRLRAESVLLTETDSNAAIMWTSEDVGYEKASQSVEKGFIYNALAGLRVIRTIKNDILRRGNIYCFTEENFLGRFYYLNQPKFYVDKIANTIYFQSWQDVGMALANVQSTVKIELYSADATSNDAQGLLSKFVSLPEDQLGAVNNRVDAGVNFPYIETF